MNLSNNQIFRSSNLRKIIYLFNHSNIQKLIHSIKSNIQHLKSNIPIHHSKFKIQNPYTFTPKKYPTKAVKPIANVPHIVIRNTALSILDPPNFAAATPSKPRNKIQHP
jgi:hypothetical protein